MFFQPGGGIGAGGGDVQVVKQGVVICVPDQCGCDPPAGERGGYDGVENIQRIFFQGVFEVCRIAFAFHMECFIFRVVYDRLHVVFL